MSREEISRLRLSKRGISKRDVAGDSHNPPESVKGPVLGPLIPTTAAVDVLSLQQSIPPRESGAAEVSNGFYDSRHLANPTPASPGAPLGQLAFTTVSDSPSQQQQHPSYIGDSGYMQIFSHESGKPSQQQSFGALPQIMGIDNIPPGLQESHLDVFFEYALTWCPILDRHVFDADPDLNQSLLLRHALALCGNQIKPSLLVHASSMDHYNRAKELFYGNHEPNPLVRIMALMLFYWWSTEPPNVVSLDTTWWWTGTAIRLAQQIGLHREPSPNQALLAAESPGLRRRVWWTLVARERISAASQGRPCLIDLDDCDVPMPTPNDFPNPHDVRTSLFIAWVPLCEIIGRLGKMLRRRRDADSTAIPLARELINWVQSLSFSLQPAIRGNRTTGFNRDVHGMHLTYLSSITLLHLNKEAQPLPKASIAAIVAASCTARIFHDYLLRGSVTFLAGQAGWYITIATLALLHARRLEGLTADADADIRILRAALGAMARQWHSAQVFQAGIDKLIEARNTTINNNNDNTSATNHSVVPTEVVSPSIDELSAIEGINWQDYFPYISGETSPLIGRLLTDNKQAIRLPELGWTFDFPSRLNQFFSRPDDFNVDFFSF
ncbi:hypothetical protein AYL99_08662 [Fonsecaea erecta]|uniref:Xylanolytic transcriptional activator regulatory domain-containing protein n=1 Tax=Fonsecaea erecta TaxID=1367422 RepID=A0A178ZDP1_9EURO|nr:hypothetical protein AYL99_08662 [Fonsecaea erecta]OAP57924.1 hypothetical protein AYL99_08662 [Fonsecaea erecta]